MQEVVLVVHLILALAIIILVLLQRSEGGGLGIGGGGMGNFASAGDTASALTKTTMFFAIGFFCTSLTLGYLAKRESSAVGLLDQLVEKSESKAVEVDVVEEVLAPVSGGVVADDVVEAVEGVQDAVIEKVTSEAPVIEAPVSE